MIVRIQNFKDGLNRKELKKLFKPYGRVRFAIVCSETAFVDMPNKNDAREAVENLNGLTHNDRQLNIELSAALNTDCIQRTKLGFVRLL